MPVRVKLNNEQRVSVKCTPVTPGGSPAEVDGDVEFDCDDPSVKIERIDPMSAWLYAPDSNVGDFVVIISADADLGEGKTEIKDTVILEVSSPQAASLGISVGTPETKPPPTARRKP